MARRFVFAAVFLAAVFGTAEADIPNPRIFEREYDYREGKTASFDLTPSASEKNTLELEITPKSSGVYGYSFVLMSADTDTVSEVIHSVKGKPYKHSGESLKASFIYRTPERGRTLNYKVRAYFSRSQRQRQIRDYKQRLRRNNNVTYFTGKITVSNIEGVIYVSLKEEEKSD